MLIPNYGPITENVFNQLGSLLELDEKDLSNYLKTNGDLNDKGKDLIKRLDASVSIKDSMINFISGQKISGLNGLGKTHLRLLSQYQQLMEVNIRRQPSMCLA